MRQADGAGIILMRENALLPLNLSVESEPFLPGWRIVKNLDSYAFSRRIKETNWRFVYLVGQKKARVLGRTGRVTLRRGVDRILGEFRGRRFNSLEITVVVLRRFLGFSYLGISANLRHIQSDGSVSI